MSEQLSREEVGFVASLLHWDAERRRRDTTLLLVALAAGGAVILTAIAMTLRHLTDRVVVYITVPGFALGIALILVYAVGSARVHRRHRMAGILRKLGAGAAVPVR